MLSYKLNIIFDGQFYISIFEKTDNDKLSVARHIFGLEPSDIEVFEYINHEFDTLVFSSPIDIDKKVKTNVNPKKMQRMVKKEMKSTDIGTKSQIALKKLQEEKKIEKKEITKEQKEIEKKLNYKLKQEKKLEKHKGH